MNGAASAGLRVEDKAGVRRLMLDRPEARNAFNDELYDAVSAALADASDDDGIGACVLAATGPVFSAGQDRQEMARRRSREEAAAYGFVPFARRLAAFDKPLIGAVQGPAVGVGVTMLLHCDVVLVTSAARFRTPFVELGIVPEAASTVLLPARIGPLAAAEMLLTGRWVDADQAVAWRLASRLCPPERLIDEACAVAAGMAAFPRAAVVATKKLLVAARSEAVELAVTRELDELVRLMRARVAPG